MTLGRFITLEGGEGAGKSTLAKGLAAALERIGVAVVSTREPGGTEGADEIRALLVRGERHRWSPLSETLLLMAARNDHLERVIKPALSAGACVICDRFTDSTLAYQAAAGGVPPTAVQTLSGLIGAPTPDLTLILDVDPAIGLGRAKSTAAGEARFEQRDGAFHSRVRAAFLDLARTQPGRCVVLDASRAPNVVLDDAREAVARRLGFAL
ncbi:MAG: dTMP kinase [Hyphomonadaceae bacterium]|nr:dTMP kinase [Hyphomonadaceae bacterium]